MPPAALRTLLSGLIDYAGLFPPAALPLAEVARNYGGYRRSADAWALGRLVVPAARLGELAALVPPGEHWPVSTLLGDDVDADIQRIATIRADPQHATVVDTVEGKFSSPHDVARVATALGAGTTVYAEVPPDRLGAMLPALRDSGVRAKIRTGGVIPEAIPSSRDVAQFIAACATAGVPVKATAGLHHPLRATYALTYASDAPRAPMHGFLNVFLAAALATAGADTGTLVRLLDDGDVHHFSFDDDGAGWDGHRISADAMQHMRADVAIAFGSCSFREPLDDLATLGLL